jgi:hypothetical protein
METWTCEVCNKIGRLGQDRPADSDNRANPNDPYNPLHDLIHICEDCCKAGYILVRGKVRVWADSPAAGQSSEQYLLVSGAQSRCNPFHDMKSWPRGDGHAGMSRSIALSRWSSRRQ